MEVNGVTGQIALRPAPVAVFDDQTGIGGQGKVVRLAYDQLESALLQEWHQRGQPGGADLFARPTRPRVCAGFRVGCHSLSSSGVGSGRG
jgi:hypothetical protein